MKTVPLYSESANYKEWEVTTEAGMYTIIHDNDGWCLLRQKEDKEWAEQGEEEAIELFLALHGLVLESA